MKNMKILTNKKATSELWWILITAIIAILVVVLIVVWFKGGGTRLFDTIGTQIDQLGDCDKDKVLFDSCPCIPVEAEENPQAKGCPAGTPKNDDTACCSTKKS